MDDIVLNFFEHLALGIEVVVLGGYYNSIDAYRFVIITIFQGYLTFSVGAEVSNLFVFTA